MNSRRVASYIDDVLADRRPKRFKGAGADAGVLRAAIAMRAAAQGRRFPRSDSSLPCAMSSPGRYEGPPNHQVVR